MLFVPASMPTTQAQDVLCFGAIIDLNKVYYSPTDDVEILISAPDFNKKPNVVEYIGTDANSRVTIITSQGTLDFYKLKEIGNDVGVFEGSISLNSASTSGTGPWSGKIKTGNQDTITIEFTNTCSGNADLISTQAFVDGPTSSPIQSISTSDYKKYTDDDSIFTIEYPDDWVLGDSHADSIIAFNDQYDWRTDFQVFLNEDDSLDNRSDSKVLRAIEGNQWELCDEYTFAGAGDRKCSDFKVVDSYTMKTNDDRKVYFVKMTYTLEWEDYLRGQENSMIKTLGLIYDGDHSWEMAVESFEYVFLLPRPAPVEPIFESFYSNS